MLGSFSAAWNTVKSESKNVLLDNNSHTIVIGLYGTRNMCKMKELAHKHHLGDSDSGHYAVISLDIKKSIATILDSQQIKFEESVYFPAESIKEFVTEMYDFFRTENGYAERPLKFDQIRYQTQFDSDCGCNMLINIELLINNVNPSGQTFTPFIIDKIRHYHSLLYNEKINDFRLGLN